MKAWCGQSPKQLDGDMPDVIVLPERIAMADLDHAGQLCPDALIAGAPTLENGEVRGILKYRGEELTNYIKVGCDDRFKGAGVMPDPLPFAEVGDIAIGILVCRDFDDYRLAALVLDELRAKKAAFKVLCIPAAMHGHLFTFAKGFGILKNPGVHVALCNGEPTYQKNREPSFIAGPDGGFIVEERERRPIDAHLRAG